MKLLIKGGRVINPAKKFDEIADVLIEDGRIKDVGKNLMDDDDTEVYDAAGKIVAPGLIDMHVHFREPGQEAKEDFHSGSSAAAAGGYTMVATMPNTMPVIDTAALVRSMKKRADEVGKVHIRIIGAVTKNQEGKELAELGDMVEAGAVAFSDDGHFDPSAKVLLNAYDYLHAFDKVIINHEEETSLIEEGIMNEGHRSVMLGVKGRPTIAEDIAAARDIMLAEYAGARVHVAHISSAGAVDIVRQAKKRGVRVTTEVTPQHLTMTDSAVELFDSSTKINPPLREQKDVDATLKGLLDGTIDMIATDHAPHSLEDKSKGFDKSSFGVVGLETSFAVSYTELVKKNVISFERLVELMSVNPRKRFGLPGGYIENGEVADICIVDTETTWKVNPEEFQTKGRSTPFEGMNLTGKVIATFVDGKLVYRDEKDK